MPPHRSLSLPIRWHVAHLEAETHIDFACQPITFHKPCRQPCCQPYYLRTDITSKVNEWRSPGVRKMLISIGQIVLSIRGEKATELVLRPPLQGAKLCQQLPSLLAASTCMLNQATSPRYTGWCYSTEISASNHLSDIIRYIRLRPEAVKAMPDRT